MKNTFAKMFTVCALAGVLGFALSACDDSSSAGGDNGSGGNRGGIPDTVETFMELSDYDCGKSQKCVATYLMEYHDMAVCDGDNGWVIGTLIEKMDCDFSSSSDKSSDSKSNDPAEVTDDSSDSKDSPSSAGTSTKSSNSSSSSVTPSDVEGSSKTAWDYLNPDINYGEFTDERDGQVYKTVKIGDQIWMAQNLNYAYTGVKFSAKGNTSDSTSWCYENKVSNCDKYGRLYTWSAVMDSAAQFIENARTTCGHSNLTEGTLGSRCNPNSPHRGICPEGWHVPTEQEFSTLHTYIGGSNTGGLLLKSTSGWYSGGNGTDKYGFSELSAGYRSGSGYFYDEGRIARLWTATNFQSDAAMCQGVNWALEGLGVGHGANNKREGYSVRCVKDSE